MYHVCLPFLMVLLPAIVAEPCSQPGAVRIVDSDAGSNTVEECRNNEWIMACGTQMGCNAAVVACRETMKVESPRVVASDSFNPLLTDDKIGYYCYGNEPALSNCSSELISCPSYVGHAICIAPQSCSQGAIRLVGGETSDTGRLELCYNGEWSSVLYTSITDGFGYIEAATACTQLGYIKYPRLYTDGHYDSVEPLTYSWITNIACKGDENILQNCTITKTTSNCTYYSFEITTRRKIGLQCYKAATQCSDGAVRLVGGRIEQEGRVEVCLKGVWGSVCHSEFTDTDLYISCSYAGYHGNSNTFLTNGWFGSGDGPVLRGFDCQGWEQNMAECLNHSQQYDYKHNSDCNPDSATAVRCSDFCSDGNVRLVGGPNTTSGIVEFCSNNLWGLIAGPGWSYENARVICNQLSPENVPLIGTPVHNASHLFSRPKKLIHLANVYCTGSESVISDCAAHANTISAGIDMIKEVDVAGVVCYIDTAPRDPSGTTTTANQTVVQGSSIAMVVITGFILLILLILGSGAIIATVCWSRSRRVSWQQLPTDDKDF